MVLGAAQLVCSLGGIVARVWHGARHGARMTCARAVRCVPRRANSRAPWSFALMCWRGGRI